MSPGCAPRTDPPAPLPAPIAVPVTITPPADLLRCADRPAGLPEDPALVAQIPTRARAGIIRLARAFGANADQLDRLVEFVSPGACHPKPSAALPKD